MNLPQVGPGMSITEQKPYLFEDAERSVKDIMARSNGWAFPGKAMFYMSFCIIPWFSRSTAMPVSIDVQLVLIHTSHTLYERP